MACSWVVYAGPGEGARTLLRDLSLLLAGNLERERLLPLLTLKDIAR